MKAEIFSYRYAAEIMQHENYRQAWDEITGIVETAPTYVWPGKSDKKPSLDTLQHLLNSHFDMAFARVGGWDYHPLATKIPNSNLKADFRKTFAPSSDEPLSVQVEVQFGNMARWYSDIFKFQSAYSEELAQIGVCIIPKASLAKRIDQNIVSFERACRELPSAKLSITLPILMIGVDVDEVTVVHDVRRSQFSTSKAFSYRGVGSANRARILNGLAAGLPMEAIGPDTDAGAVYAPNDEDESSDASGG